MVLSVGFGCGAGWLVAKVTRCQRQFHRLLVATCGLANMGNLPLVLVAELASDTDSALYGLKDAGLGYVAITLSVATLSHFVMGYHLLQKHSDDPPDDPSVVCAPCASGASAGTSGTAALTTLRRSRSVLVATANEVDPAKHDVGLGVGVGSDDNDDNDGGLNAVSLEEGRQPVVELATTTGFRGRRIGSPRGPYDGHPPPPERGFTSETGNKNHDHDSDMTAPHHVRTISASSGGPPPRFSHRLFSMFGGRATKHSDQDQWRRSQDERTGPPLSPSLIPVKASIFRRIWKMTWLQEVMTPPTIATFIGILIGSVKALKHLFYRENATSGEPPLEIVRAAIKSLGDAAIPCMMLVLGANLTRGPPKESKISKTVVISVVTFRLLVSACLGLTMFGLWKAGAFSVPDAAFGFVMLLLWAMPSAINLQTLSNMTGYGVNELSVMLFWQYITCIVILPFVIFFYLFLAEEMIK